MVDAKKEAEVKEYIEKEIRKGFKLSDIERVLLKWGYPEDFVSKEISKYSDSTPLHHRIMSPKVALAAFFCLVLLVLISSLFLNKEVRCDSDECFIEYASDCKPTFYSKIDAGIVFEFESTKDCVMEKKLQGLPDSEPLIIRDLLLDKGMICTYSKEGFDERWTSTLLGGLENCNGELKDALYEIAIAQYEIALEDSLIQ